jgi:hypothetical protein
MSVLIFQIETFAQRRRVQMILCPDGPLLHPIERGRCRDPHARAGDFLDLSVDGFESSRFAKTREHIEVEVARWRIVADGRIFPQQIGSGNLVDVRVALVRVAQRGPKPFDVFRRSADEDIQILRCAYKPVKSHRCRTDEHVLETRILKGSQHPDNFVTVHSARIACRRARVTCELDTYLPARAESQRSISSLATLAGRVFATLWLINGIPDGERIALTSARSFKLLADLEKGEEKDYSDPHSPDGQRFYDTICLLYGHRPDKYEYLIKNGTLPRERAFECEEDYSRLHKSWQTLLAPHLVSRTDATLGFDPLSFLRVPGYSSSVK